MTLYTDDICIVEDVETRFDTSNYKLECKSTDTPLPKGKNKKVIRLMKDKLGAKIMTKSWKCFNGIKQVNARYKMNEITSKLLLAGDKFMPEIH